MIVLRDRYRKKNTDTVQIIVTSMRSVKIWFMSAFRSACSWKMFCMLSDIEAKNRRAIQNMNATAMNSNEENVWND